MAIIIENLDAARSALIDLLRREYDAEHDDLVADFFDADRTALRVLASGWGTIDGMLVYRPETRFAATTRAMVVSGHERALRDLLLAAPRGDALLLLVAGAWTLPTLAELFDGHEVAPRPPLSAPTFICSLAFGAAAERSPSSTTTHYSVVPH